MKSAEVRKEGAGQGKRPAPAVLRRVAVFATLGLVALGLAAAFVINGRKGKQRFRPCRQDICAGSFHGCRRTRC